MAAARCEGPRGDSAPAFGHLRIIATFAAVIFVTRALLVQNGCLLAAQRPLTMSLPLKWELPGGKLEENESPEQGLMREVKEEFDLLTAVKESLPAVDHHFRDKVYQMLPFLCEVTGGELQVNEHAQARWVPFSEIHLLDWAPAEVLILRKAGLWSPAAEVNAVGALASAAN